MAVSTYASGADLVIGTARRRFFAAAIDGLLLSGVQLLLCGDWPEVPTSTLEMARVIAFFGACPIYFIACTAVAGRTLGKALLGLRVGALDGSRVSLGYATARYFPWVVLAAWQTASFGSDAGHLAFLQSASGGLSSDALVLRFVGLGWVIVDGVCLLVNRQRRALHDFFGQTQVFRQARIDPVAPHLQSLA